MKKYPTLKNKLKIIVIIFSATPCIIFPTQKKSNATHSNVQNITNQEFKNLKQACTESHKNTQKKKKALLVLCSVEVIYEILRKMEINMSILSKMSLMQLCFCVLGILAVLFIIHRIRKCFKTF
jgi:hypothetical protein